MPTKAGGADGDEACVKSHLTKPLHITVNDQNFAFPSINYKKILLCGMK